MRWMGLMASSIKKLIITKCQRCGRGAGRRQRLIAISFLWILEFFICRQGSGCIHLINPRSDSSRSPRDRPRKVVGTTVRCDQVEESQLPKISHSYVELDRHQRETLQSPVQRRNEYRTRSRSWNACSFNPARGRSL